MRKNKISKRLLSVLLAMVFTVSAIVILSGTAYAVNEIEDNNSKSAATPISVNTKVNGKLSQWDNDFYSFSIKNDGYVYVTFNHDYKTNTDVFANVDIVDYYNYNSTCDASTSSSIKVGLKAGTYYIHITEHYGYDQFGDNASYDFTVNYSASNVWETESNGSSSDADIIETGKTYYGSLSNYDNDFYSFSIKNDGYVYVTFNHDYKTNTDVFANVDIVNYYNYHSRCDTKTSSSIKVGLKAGTYYLHISEYYGNDQFGNNADYNFTVNYTASNAWETEYNGSSSDADVIETGRTYHGTLFDSDNDYYAFNLSRQGSVQLVFNHATINNTDRFAYISIESYTNTYSTCNVSSVSTDTVSLEAGTYYIRINEYYAYDHYAEKTDYSFKVIVDGQSAADEYTLSYNANGGKGAPSAQTGSGSIKISNAKPSRSNYNFLGWSTDSSASFASYQPGDTIFLSSDTVLYAVWESANPDNSDTPDDSGNQQDSDDSSRGEKIKSFFSRFLSIFKEFIPLIIRIFRMLLGAI